MNTHEVSLVLSPGWRLPAVRAFYRFFEVDENPDMACTKTEVLNHVAVTFELKDGSAELKDGSGSTVDIAKITSIKWTADDDGKLKSITVRTIDMVSGNLLSPGMRGVLVERYYSQKAKTGATFVGAETLEVDSVRTSFEAGSLPCVTIFLVPAKPAQS